MLKYKGAQQFRQRILLATLSGRPVRIDGIRETHEQVGLRDYEAGFLRLLEKVVNGCEIVINETGTAMRYRPGIIVGGAGLVHDCGTSRAISYFLQPLLILAPFAKSPLTITLKGITNGMEDVGVDVLRTVTMPMLRHFGIEDGDASGNRSTIVSRPPSHPIMSHISGLRSRPFNPIPSPPLTASCCLSLPPPPQYPTLFDPI